MPDEPFWDRYTAMLFEILSLQPPEESNVIDDNIDIKNIVKVGKRKSEDNLVITSGEFPYSFSKLK